MYTFCDIPYPYLHPRKWTYLQVHLHIATIKHPINKQSQTLFYTNLHAHILHPRPQPLLTRTHTLIANYTPEPTLPHIVSENKVLTHPSSVDSLSTSAGTEDHVSMGGYAARKSLIVVEHVEQGSCVCFYCYYRFYYLSAKHIETTSLEQEYRWKLLIRWLTNGILNYVICKKENKSKNNTLRFK